MLLFLDTFVKKRNISYKFTTTRYKSTRTMKEKSITVGYEFLLTAFCLNLTAPNKQFFYFKTITRISYTVM